MRLPAYRPLLCLLAVCSSASEARAGARHFTYLYEAVPTAPGEIEIENSVTFRTGTDQGDRFSTVDFRHEFEFGITPRLQLSLYVADWDWHSGSDERPSGCSYDGTAVEAIYNLSNPVADPVGVSLYEEIRGGYHSLESESKLILQKNFGPIIVACNLTLEAEWEGDGLRESQGEFQDSLGVSYEFNARFSAGVEFVHEIEMPGWRANDAVQNVFVGPNVSFRKSQWFLTVTALAQATATEGEPDVQVRSIVGYAF